MLDTLLNIIAPHLCLNCQKIGEILCNSCTKYIVSKQFKACVLCENLSEVGICRSCKPAEVFERAWVLGERRDVLKRLIDRYKFERARAAHKVGAALLHAIIPPLPHETIVVPIPTIAPHIRQRSYDHCSLLARKFAQLHHLHYLPLLKRSDGAVQHIASRRTRAEQAKAAFRVNQALAPEPLYLIIDDVITTGSTIYWAAQALRRAGAVHIAVAVLAKQPLDGRE